MNNDASETDDKSALGKNWFWGALAVIAVIALFQWPRVAVWLYQAANSYTCENLVPDIVALSKENESDLFPVRLIDIVEIRTVSTTDSNISCGGLGILNNRERSPVSYRAYVEFDKWWIEYDLED